MLPNTIMGNNVLSRGELPDSEGRLTVVSKSHVLTIARVAARALKAQTGLAGASA